MEKNSSSLTKDISILEAEKIYEPIEEKKRKRNGRTLTKLCSGFVAGATGGIFSGYLNSIFDKFKYDYQKIDLSLETNPVFEFFNNSIMQNFPDFYNRMEILYENLITYGNNVASNITNSQVYTNNRDSIALGACVGLGISALVYLVMDSFDHNRLCKSIDIESKFYKNNK